MSVFSNLLYLPSIDLATLFENTKASNNELLANLPTLTVNMKFNF